VGKEAGGQGGGRARRRWVGNEAGGWVGGRVETTNGWVKWWLAVQAWRLCQLCCGGGGVG
jgi:hypothetical protein